jgi:hypothetical protein
VLGSKFAAEHGEKTYPRNVVRQLHDYEGAYDEVWGSGKHGNFLDIGGTHHHHRVLFLDGPNASLVRFWQIDAWHPRCSADSKATVISKRLFNKMRTGLNYADLIGTPYANTTVPKLGGYAPETGAD